MCIGKPSPAPAPAAWRLWTHSAGWRMPGNKGGRRERQALRLSDLKRLNKMAAPAPIPASAAPTVTTTAKTGKKISEPGLSREDALLFRRSMQTVIPIKGNDRAVLPPRTTGPGDILRQRREHAVGRDPVRLAQTSDHYSSAKVDSDDSHYLRTGHGPDVLKDLKRGKWPI